MVHQGCVWVEAQSAALQKDRTESAKESVRLRKTGKPESSRESRRLVGTNVLIHHNNRITA